MRRWHNKCMTLKLIQGDKPIKPSPRRGKSPTNSPLVSLARRYIQCAMAKSIERGLNCGQNEIIAGHQASYAAGLRDALHLLEKAAEDLNGKVSL